MQTINKDYSAFLAKLTTARYERKGDPDMGEVIDKMAEGIETFKQTQATAIEQLSHQLVNAAKLIEYLLHFFTGQHSG